MAVARDWEVMAVFDPDGTGGDFAYTVGLAERGLPELHVWARPPDGEDPGEDWKFSARDCGHLLNACAERLIDGRLAVGDSWGQPYDGGLVRVDFTIGAPAGRLDVEALTTRPDAVVLPVRWSLHRAPAGRLGPIDDVSEPQVRFELKRAVGALDPVAVARLPLHWQPGRAPSFDADQRYGPLTPLVVAVGAAVATADVEMTHGFVDAALCMASACGHRYGDALIAAEARAVGRQRALRALDDAVEEITRLVAGRPQRPSRRWQAVGEIMFGDTSGDRRRALLHGARHVLEEAIGTLVGLQVVADIATDAARRAGSGPWSWGRGHAVAAPSPLWWAPREQMARVRRVVGPLDGARLAMLGEIHEIEMGAPRDPLRTPYAQDVSWLRGMAIAEPVAMPRPESWLLGTPAGMELLELAAGDTAAHGHTRRHAESTLEAMAALTTAVAVANVVAPDRLRTVAAPYAVLLPGLAGEIAGRAAA